MLIEEICCFVAISKLNRKKNENCRNIEEIEKEDQRRQQKSQ